MHHTLRSVILAAVCTLALSQQASAQQAYTWTWVGPVSFETGSEIWASADMQVDYGYSVYYCMDARVFLYRDGAYLGDGYMSNYCVNNVTHVSGQVGVLNNIPDAEYTCSGDFTATTYTWGETADYYNYQAYLEPPLVYDYYHNTYFNFFGSGPPRPDIGPILLGIVYSFFQQGNPPGNCGDQRDDIRREYVTHRVNLRPACQDFTQTRHGTYFTFNELNTGDFNWALIRDPLIVNEVNNYGLNRWRLEYGGPRIVNSAYRNPARNARVGGVATSRHMHGDAADLRNVTQTVNEYNSMAQAAGRANADFIEPLNGPCMLGCVHADWRNHAGGYR
jgi:hypothetical protein